MTTSRSSDHPGARVQYKSVGGPLFTGTVRGGGCYDSACTYVHVDCDNGHFHHVNPTEIAPKYFAAEDALKSFGGWR